MADLVVDVPTTSLEPGSARDSINTRHDLGMDFDDDASNTITSPEQLHMSESDDLLEMVSSHINTIIS